MSPEEKAREDLPLDEREAEGVTGGAVELSGGVAGESRRKTTRTDMHRTAGITVPTSDPDQYQVSKNDKI